MNINIYKISLATLLTVCFGITGCKKFVQVPAPIDQIPTNQVFNTDAKANSAVRGLYAAMSGSTNSFIASLVGYAAAIQVSTAAGADEIAPSAISNTFYPFFTNSISSADGNNSGYIWGTLYNYIFNANAVIENLEKSTAVTAAGTKQYLSEAKFIRAFNYFYLVNLYGDIPLVTGTDYRINANLPRVPAAKIYDLIIDDLKYAQANISVSYVSGTQRLRANKYAASALLARVYLYKGDWVNAEAQANEVIDVAGKTIYDIEPDLSKTFLTTSKEVILQIQQPGSNLYTWDGWNFLPSSTTSVPQYLITDNLYKAFELNDKRKTEWIKFNNATVGGVTKPYYYPAKYKLRAGTGTVRSESLVVLRLSEVYLIRAEARAMQHKLADAIKDLDVIRFRAGINKIADTNPNIGESDLLAVIAHERYVELFTELGQRWMDLKRTGKADEVLKDKPNWRPEAKLYPIPADEIDKNPFLKQNPGYN